MMDYVLLYPRELSPLKENGEITSVEYPPEAKPGALVFVKAIMVCNMPYGTPWPDRQFIFILVNKVTREQLDFSNKFIAYPASTHEEVMTFNMPDESIALELQLRWYDPDRPEMTWGVLEDLYDFSITAILVSLTVRSAPIVGVPVKIDGVEQVTPAFYDVSAGTYRVIVPSRFEGRDFERWEDGSTDPLRIITVLENTVIVAYYEAVEEEEKPPWYEEYAIPLIVAGAAVTWIILSQGD